MLRQLDDSLWVIDHPLSMAGLRIGTRTTLVRLADGGLFMHSPGPLSVPLAQEIDALGPVRCIVAPNRFHHRFVTENAKAWRAASVHLAPGLAGKRKDLSFDAELGATPSEPWAADLDQLCLGGAPTFGEVVFLHQASHTLILTDMCFNFPEIASGPLRWFLKLNDANGRFTPSRMLRMLVRDREAARESVERMLAWDFERVIVAHGQVLERGGRRALREAWAWLLSA